MAASDLPIKTPAARLFEQERVRLLDAFGAIPAGGVIEAIEPLDLVRADAASPGVAIGISVWPYPLGPAQQAVLGALGLRRVYITGCCSEAIALCGSVGAAELGPVFLCGRAAPLPALSPRALAST